VDRSGAGIHGNSSAAAATRWPETAHVELPLLFVSQDDRQFLRSIWRPLSDKASRCPYAPAKQEGAWNEEHVKWAAIILKPSSRQEENWSLQLAEHFDQDSRWSEYYSDQNLRERLLAESPPLLRKR